MPCKTLIFLFLLVLAQAGQAQTDRNFSLQLRFNPFVTLSRYTPVAQPGIQANWGKWGLSADYGFRFTYLADSLWQKGVRHNDARYYKLRAELKYFENAGNDVFPYVSLEGFYTPKKYRKNNDWVIRNNEYFYYVYSDIRYRTLGFALKGGMEWRPKWFVLDFFGGIGLRHLDIRHHTFAEQTQPDGFVPESVFREWDRIDGRVNRLYIALGLKLGVSLVR